MANPEHVEKLKEGVEAWNEWRKAHPKVTPDLRHASLIDAGLSGANLRKVNLSLADLGKAKLNDADLRAANLVKASLGFTFLAGATLDEADLSEADLPYADFSFASLKDVNLSGADLTGAVFRGADLRRADLSFADLTWANLNGANLTGADFISAHVNGTTFADLDLYGVRGLETVSHEGPSIIGLDVIYRTQRKIPEAFLRGAGVPDNLINYAQSLVANPIEFYSCFISHSTKDQAFADRLYADLQNNNVRCWFARHDVRAGKKIHEQIHEAIRLYDKLLLILSSASMQSEWVQTEIAKARKREIRDKRRVLFPIRIVPFETLREWECFDADTGKDSAREIREYFIPDFSHWKKHDAYQKAFKGLIDDLKTEKRKGRISARKAMKDLP